MKYHKLLIAGLLSISLACQQATENKQEKKVLHKESAATRRKVSVKTETRAESVSTFPCAILYEADPTKIKAFKAKMNEEDFYTVADDSMWYLAQAREFLEKQNVEIVDTKESKILLTGKNHKPVQIDVPIDQCAALYFYDGINPPVEADLTMVDEDYKKFIQQAR